MGMEGFHMIIKPFSGLLLLEFLFSVVDGAHWSCSEEGKAMPIIPSKVAGAWYEIARLPSSEVPACLEVIAPEEQLNGSYALELNYMNNVNNNVWKSSKETLVFPWSEVANGNFNLLYTDGVFKINVRFKYLGSFSGYCAICGYTDIAAGVNIIRILSRNRSVSNSVKTRINALADQLHVGLSALTWVEQDGRCNGSEKLFSLKVFHVFAICFFQKILRNILPA